MLLQPSGPILKHKPEFKVVAADSHQVHQYDWRAQQRITWLATGSTRFSFEDHLRASEQKWLH
jgi:hypothetical protein